MSFEDDQAREDPEMVPEYDWRDYGDHDQSASTSLDGRDIVALFVAALQTIFLPLVILAISMLIIGIAIGLIF